MARSEKPDSSAALRTPAREPLALSSFAPRLFDRRRLTMAPAVILFGVSRGIAPGGMNNGKEQQIDAKLLRSGYWCVCGLTARTRLVIPGQELLLDGPDMPRVAILNKLYHEAMTVRACSSVRAAPPKPRRDCRRARPAP